MAKRRSSTNDGSRRSYRGDASFLEELRLCAWCGGEIPARARIDALTCSRKCRQSIFRFKRLGLTRPPAGEPANFAYADPPYPGTAATYYKDEPTYDGEVDHPALIEQLIAGGYAGWALSTSMKAVRALLPLCPEGARLCPWVKPIGANSNTYGPHNCWEAVIVVGGRLQRGGVRDWLRAQPARGGGTLPGRKPLAFCAWLFDLLGMQPGDELDDLFPGTGIVGRAWRVASSTSRTTQAVELLPATRNDVVSDRSVDGTPATRRPGAGDASRPRGVNDTSRRSAEDDVSLRSSTTPAAPIGGQE